MAHMNLLQFPPAYAPSILRAARKDKQYELELRQLLLDVVDSVAGSRIFMRYQAKLILLSQLLYYIITTGAGRQTLGEEYCDIIQNVSGTTNKPSLLRRLFLITAQIIVPVLAVQTQSSSRMRIDIDYVDLAKDESPVTPVAETQSTYITALQKRARSVKEFFQQYQGVMYKNAFAIHLAMFYFSGKYYHFAKRASQIRYISLIRYSDDSAMNTSYAPLGAMILFELLIANSIKLYRYHQSVIATQTASENSLSLSKGNIAKVVEIKPLGVDTQDNSKALDRTYFSSGDCILCLCRRASTTITLCGHLFCWQCICEWNREKSECPLCRQPLEARQLICVNF